MGLHLDHYNKSLIAPSILACDFSQLGIEVGRVISAGADRIHCDVMDGHFVKNISFGSVIIQAVARSTKLPLDIHLMVDCPQHHLLGLIPHSISSFFHSIIFHIEASQCVSETLHSIRDQRCLAGIAINPETPLFEAYPFLANLDFLLIMTVYPGSGGQDFLPGILKKIRAAAEVRSQKRLGFHIAVDGGICAETAAKCRLAGANVFVAGTAIFGKPDLFSAVQSIRSSVTNL
ncbi:Ribulose-phosphate 3-epimerase [Candidatus Xiphinematobacter sp. Idaho Grape]|uniref:ribulose-phosphate 3-epimerase n=1 Tax=Candidatus Xiphinematobacter sp. Idaho Grape TaxID=1704307 RepID=UPI0007067774|nr:ribulose-phosphate 3-epimerase [Candidatus Xiphinematobacter sp. Idaho Grape]ALJ56737.1 Ribulose-phosphate 3-epimerase [Candidatus Xiphinematobacter sp. Idaho Grape]